MTQSTSRAWVFACFTMLGTACAAHTPPPRTFRYAELVRHPESGRHIFEQPIILAFEPGERLPINLAFDDALFALDPATPSLALVAKERCFVRIDEHGIHSSPDPANFDAKPRAPGSFFLGFSHHNTGPRLEINVKTPQR